VLNAAVGDAKTQQMEGFTQHQDKNTPLTTYFGTKMAETDVALRAGARGPTVLEGTLPLPSNLANVSFSFSISDPSVKNMLTCIDFHNREKISHFDHERIRGLRDTEADMSADVQPNELSTLEERVRLENSSFTPL
jgi:catalase